MSAGIDFLMAMATNNGKKINVCVSRQRREHRPLSCGVQCGGNLCVCVCVCVCGVCVGVRACARGPLYRFNHCPAGQHRGRGVAGWVRWVMASTKRWVGRSEGLRGRCRRQLAEHDSAAYFSAAGDAVKRWSMISTRRACSLAHCMAMSSPYSSVHSSHTVISNILTGVVFLCSLCSA